MSEISSSFAARHSSFAIARRSLSLSKTYVVISLFLSVIGIAIANINHVILGLNVGSTPTQPTDLQIVSALPLIAIPLMVFSTLTLTTPVILLYVYDKNNGVLEYFLSLGMNQGDVYRGYLKASLLLASFMFVYEIALIMGIGILLGTGFVILFETLLLTPTIGYAVVAFTTVAMMAFGSLQKQRVGSNQPLGMGIGVALVLPTYFVPIIAPGFAVTVDLIIAAIIATMSFVLFLLASRLIRREKLLP